MPQAGEIRSNLKRSELDYDEELPTPVVTDPLPYTDTSSAELIEAEQKAWEDNYRAAESQRWKGQERWMGKENEEMRLVNILHPHAVFRKLQEAGVNCSIEPSLEWVWDTDHKTGLTVPLQRTRNSADFWLHDVVIKDRVGITGWLWRNGRRTAQYVTYMQYPQGPEWSLMKFNEYDVPLYERYRGWRTAILRLIQEELVTEAQVERAFGPVTENEASELYLIQLEEFRKMKGNR